jgi:hypothetical protein
MKEESELRKSFLADTQPTTQKTLARRTDPVLEAPLFPATSRKSSMVLADVENPQVLSEGRYEKVFR